MHFPFPHASWATDSCHGIRKWKIWWARRRGLNPGLQQLGVFDVPFFLLNQFFRRLDLFQQKNMSQSIFLNSKIQTIDFLSY